MRDEFSVRQRVKLDESELASASQDGSFATNQAIPDRGHVLDLHFQRDASACYMMQKASHRNIHGCGEHASMQQTLRIEEGAYNFERNDALIGLVADNGELHLRMMFAGGQVDQMVRDKYQEGETLINSSVIDLIRTLAKSKKPGRIAISKSEFSVAISRN